MQNGQTPGDRIGSSTCFNNSCAHEVDYVLAESPVYQKITQFMVIPPEFNSKDAPITTTFQNNRVKIENEKFSNSPKV